MTYRDRILTCPHCGSPLERRTRREAWPCRQCGGVAVEISELTRLILRVAPDLVPAGTAGLEMPIRPAGDRPVVCAACGKPMKTVSLHGVELDRCEADQLVWFDSTELDRVLDAAIEDHEARKGWMRKLRDLLFAN